MPANPPANPNPTESAALATALTRAVRGEVRFDAASRALYATDASNYRQPPIGVVLPRDAEDVIATVAVCREFGAPVLPRGGGTSMAGQTCNVAVVLDFTKYMHDVVAVDHVQRRARVQPGTILDHLRDAAEVHRLTFGPDPATHDRCTLGGMIGNNSCGVHSIMAGRTVDNVAELDVLTYDGERLMVGATDEATLAAIIAAGGRRGEIYGGLRDLRDRYAERIRAGFPQLPRRVSGYNLDQLLPENGFHVARALVGTEGTCVTVLEATVELVNSPPARALLVLGFRDIFAAADAVPAVMAHKPVGLEGLDRGTLDAARAMGLLLADLALFPDGGGWLLAEFGADTPAEAAEQARSALADLTRRSDIVATRLFEDRSEQRRLWGVREAGLGATAIEPDGTHSWGGWEDAAVAPERLGGYLRAFQALVDRFGYHGHLFGHFGDGCVHVHLNFDFRTDAGRAKFRAFIDEAADLVVAFGGSLSGEHGDGQARAELLPKMFGSELVDAFREFKAIWDPQNRMNPGKVVDAYAPDENLRAGPAYDPPPVATELLFAEDGGDLRRTALRCVGVGKCRRTEGGTMCPSFMATREEAHSTRGRARLLFEMLQGDVITGGWRDEGVKSALDLCLACKACKTECPVNVDMASYKAEFLAHYHAGRIRPRAAYTMGHIGRWARLAGRAPWAANLATQTPGLRAVAKLAAGIAPARRLPRFAGEPFRHQVRRRAAAASGTRVILWPDTFNDFFHPETALAAMDVLESAGFQVEVPTNAPCCGRPFYDFGLLTQARRALEDVLHTLAEPIAAGVPIVGLEPSCVAVFRDELLRILPGRDDARRLASQSYLLPDFLARHAPDFQPAHRTGKVLVQGHCHHKALIGLGAELELLVRTGLTVDAPDTGCCGMAGAFGFERDHYDVSQTVGERVLLPAVRATAADTLIVADGFSCREQIEQATGRRTWHVAEVLAGRAGQQA